MVKNQKRRVLSILLVLSVSFCLVSSVSAATPVEEEISPQASAYLTDYTAWASAGSSGKIYVYFDVTGTGPVARLGAKLIVVQVKDAGVWKNVLTKTGTVSNGLLSANDASHGGDIVYQGTVGNTYRAVVTIYGGPTSGGDSRIVTTNSVVAVRSP